MQFEKKYNKQILIVVLFLLFLGTFFLGYYFNSFFKEKNYDFLNKSPARKEVKIQDESEYFDKENFSQEAKNNNEKELSKVLRVVDGDTIVLTNGERVRYIGIDTPELNKNSSKSAKCFAEEATKRNKELVGGKEIYLETDTTNKDKYGRLLRYVYVDNNLINYQLVREGYAQVFTFPPDTKYNNLFLQAQRKAREENIGLWRECK